MTTDTLNWSSKSSADAVYEALTTNKVFLAFVSVDIPSVPRLIFVRAGTCLKNYDSSVTLQDITDFISTLEIVPLPTSSISTENFADNSNDLSQSSSIEEPPKTNAQFKANEGESSEKPSGNPKNLEENKDTKSNNITKQLQQSNNDKAKKLDTIQSKQSKNIKLEFITLIYYLFQKIISPSPIIVDSSKENPKPYLKISKEDQEYKKNLLLEISRDRKAINESRKFYDISKAAKADSTIVQSNKPVNVNISKISVRLTNGDIKKFEFKPTDTFSKVREEVSPLLQNLKKNYQIIQSYPARVLDQSVDSTSLYDLDLVPSASLSIKVIESSSLVAEKSSSFFNYILDFFTVLIYRIYAFYLGVPYQSPAKLSYVPKRPSLDPSSSKERSKYNSFDSESKSSPIKNVSIDQDDEKASTLRRRKNARKSSTGNASDSDNVPLYNGNSTNVQ
ncbi:hypothetical protein AYI69_g11582 [Smittium culicis]|uniref:UBX domain-containing protein n=1 Tax=Smittium culicis TaxID=133412 RepID=A0A1R1WXC6_9FUNG|nr:hypothetical protein AYI69_g11582 [Smittium culicis]